MNNFVSRFGKWKKNPNDPDIKQFQGYCYKCFIEIFIIWSMSTFSLWFACLLFYSQFHINVQLPWIMLGHSYRAFTKLLALGTQKEGWAVHEVHWRYGVTEAKEQGLRKWARLVTSRLWGKLRFWVNIYTSCCECTTNDPICVCLYIIYSIYLYMYIFIYVLFSDKIKTPHAVPHIFHSSVWRSSFFFSE